MNKLVKENQYLGNVFLKEHMLLSIDGLDDEDMAARLRYLDRTIQSSVTGIYVYDIQKQSNDFINRAYTKILGYEKDELNSFSGEEFLGLFHPDDLPRVLKHMESVINAQEMFEIHEIEYRFRAKDGRWVWCLSKDTPFETSENGSVTKFIGSFMDISRQKEAEERLKIKEVELQNTLAKLELYMEGSKDAFWQLHAREPHIVETSQRFFDLIGQPQQDSKIPLAAFLTHFHPDDRTKVNAALAILEEQASCDIEARLCLSTGKYHWFRIKGTTHSDSSAHTIGIAGSMTDIHQQKTLNEKISKANRDLEQFAYVASHDLKEPLRTLKTFTKYLIEDVEKGDIERQKEDQYFIDEACDQMTHLIEDLLKLSRVGNQILEFHRFNLSEIVSKAELALGSLIAEKQASITCDGIDIEMVADKAQMLLCVQNLIHNAIKFSRDNEVPKINISAQTQDNRLVIVVKDNGIGIATQDHERIFGIFKTVQVENAGTGIGLAIVDKVMTRHGGTVSVASQPDKGATFTLSIPLLIEGRDDE
ncbi:PAS domain-containing sensor histidine kinase [Vibrio variabilis]|uniref:PAS domain-containing sensor histidine kinase n=1 Tax=Vibrio variabilis TaxID=990271 RepID=UPI0013A70A0A|nr:PAS domain-containing sensor histidine kinase [Vibrio variabilis]